MRIISPEIHSNLLKNHWVEKNSRMNSRWTSEGTGYRYADGFYHSCRTGNFTHKLFLCHLELEKIPMIDKAGLAILGNDTFLLESIHKKKGQNFITIMLLTQLNQQSVLVLKS